MSNLRLVSTICLLSAAGCQDSSATSTITIGAVIDQTSTTAWTSWSIVGEMAIAQLNQAASDAGSGLRFKLVVQDPQQDFKIAVTRARDLAGTFGAKAIVTDTSKNGIEVTKLMYDADPSNDINIPVICVTCTSPSMNNPTAVNTDPIEQATLRDDKRWNFRTIHRATEQNVVLQSVILGQGTAGDVNQDGKVKISVVALDDASGHGFVASVRSLFASTPGVIVEKVLVQGANHDLNDAPFWNGIASKAIDNNSDCPQDPTTVNSCLPAAAGDGVPDALMENLNPGYNIAVSKALADAGSKVPFFHAHAFRATQIASLLQSAINGQWGVSGVLADSSPSGDKFKTDVTAQTAAGPTLMDSSMYDAVVLSALAVIKASQGLADPTTVTGEAVRAALQQLNSPQGEVVRVGTGEFKKAFDRLGAGAAINYEGASGPVDFDAEGNIVMRLSLYQGEGGKFVDRTIRNCLADLATCPAQ
jgi:hypothetical protein